MFSIKKFNTFNLNILVKKIYFIKSKNNIRKKILYNIRKNNFFFLGEGSNVLFIENFDGIILINRIKGIKIKQNIDFWFLSVSSGELWRELVDFCLYKNIFGLENLVNIPGTVGSAIVNNIGAYGVEIKNFVFLVKVLDIYTGLYIYFNNYNCFFNYRYSIFKNVFYKRFFIIKVIFKISKNWIPCLNYRYLFNYFLKFNNIISPLILYKKIINLRSLKIPDYRILGNVGSIFKNPLITIKKFIYLKKKYFNHFKKIEFFIINKYIKIPAALLIDICNLKGYTIGKAQIYVNQPLIIVNIGNAESKDIYRLLNFVMVKVFQKFNILLELEIEIVKSNNFK